MKSYVYTVRFSFDAEDDFAARVRLAELRNKIPEPVEGSVRKEGLQEIFKNMVPRKMNL